VDVNGTRFHLVLGRQGWLGDGPAPDGLAWHAADHTLRLAEVPFVFPERTGNRRLGPSDRRGADRDRYGNWYWIGPDRRDVRFQAAGTRGSTRFWPQAQPCLPDGATGDFGDVAPPPAAAAQRFAGLAVTSDHHLVVGVPDLPGVLVFDLSAGGPPTPVPWPVALSPVDMAAAPDGGVWILDDQPGPGGWPRYWCLDRHLRIGNLAGALPDPPEPPEFQPVGPADPGRPRPPAPVASPATVAAAWAVAIEALPDGSVLVLDRGRGGPARVLHLLGERELGRLPLAPLAGPVDFAYTPDPGRSPAGTLYVAEDQGDQAFAYRLAADASALTPLPRYLPMRLFSGKALVASGGQVFCDLEERWLALADRRSPRYRNGATIDLGPLDATEPGAVWHRLTIDGRIPPGTSVRVWSRVADEREALAHAPWREEPAPYLRGLDSELPYHRFGAAGGAGAGTWELLLQRAVGRQLQLRLTIAGDGRHTPRLWALRAHRPRFSYLQQYLPDLYQEDLDAADFLDRYLANVEGLFTVLEGRIEGAQVLFGVTSLDARYLGWLGGWLGAAVDPAWDEARVRLLLQHAVELFGRRGTVRGLVEAIRLATDPCPDSSIFDGGRLPAFGVRVVESFRTRPAPGAAFAGTAPLAGPRLLESGQRWRPADGRLELDRRYREFVVARHRSLAELEGAWGRDVATGPDGASFAEPFPPLTPAAPVEAGDRADFIATSLAVTYAEVTEADLGAWGGFLAQRYRDPAALSAAWGLAGGSVVPSFAKLRLPRGTVPPDGRSLLDWVQFVSAYLPTLRAAHRFTVLVPVRLGDSDAARAERLARVTEVVARERPAHTAFQVRPYWAAFRVGEARVGLETSVAEGSRFVALVLGEGRTAQAYVGGGHPWDLPDRWVVGRDRVRLGAGDGGTEATDA
jgi:phage tail-like protein